MKQKVLKRVVSLLVAVATLVCAVPITEITVFAAGGDSNAGGNLTAGQVIEKEMAARTPITKDRSQIAAASQAAVYDNGVLVDQGEFSEMWNLAMSLASDVTGDGANSGKSKNIEYVLNRDMWYDSTWFSEGVMTISNKYFTIDLNGHVLYRIDQKDTVITIKDNSVVTIMDSNPTRENKGHIGENNIWKPIGGGHSIRGGVITGGYLQVTSGGGLYITEKSTVYMTGGTIAGNKADAGSAVCLDDGSTLDMSKGNSQICYNYCAGTTTDGGAVYLKSDCTVIGGYVHDNLADDYGGGVRANGGNIFIKDVVIYKNKAKEYGGGLYVQRTWSDQTVVVSGCKIVENSAPEGGGGAYLYNLYLTKFIDCIIEDNKADEGGAGICVNCATGTDVSVGGKMIIRNNLEGSEGKEVQSNLYLAGDDDLIVEDLALGSVIYVKTGIAPADYNGVKKPITGQKTNTSQVFFYSDVEGYYVKYQDDPSKDNYRHLYLEKGARDVEEVKAIKDFSAKLQNTPYTIESGTYKGATMPLYKGYFEFDLITSSDFVSASPFYYSDGYFFEDPTVYNTHLASMSINAAMSAFGRTTDLVEGNKYANHFANVKQLFSDIGCMDVHFFANEDYQKQPSYYGTNGRLSTIGVAISQKEIKLNDDTYTLVPVAIRGAGYGSEWGSNVSIGLSGEAQGFSDAANQVYKHIQNYIKDYGLAEKVENGKVKFWVVGYSRAGATANLTSKRLVDNYAEIGNQVYGYTFEAPMGGVESEIDKVPHTGDGKYPTIHNTVNELDFVTLVAPAEMGFIRYGVDHLIGSKKQELGIDPKDNKDYNTQRMQMVAQLNAINPYYKFDDSWEVADINIVLSNIPVIGTDMIDKGEQWNDNPNPEARKMYTFLRWFFERVQADGLLLPKEEKTGTDFSKARKYYYSLKPLANIPDNKNIPGNYAYSEMTIQEAISTLMYLVMESVTEEQTDQLIDAIMGNLDSLLGSLSIKTWDKKMFMEHVEANPALAAVATFSINLGTSLSNVIGIYNDLVNKWDSHSETEKAKTLDWLVHQIVSGPVLEALTEEQQEMLIESLPVLLWFVLNYASYDYQTQSIFNDDGMWGVGTFINNASVIISNHYPELNAAWVRSYDDFYKNEHQAYTIDKSKVVNEGPSGKLGSEGIVLSAEPGSSIFYSVDDGNSWSLYEKPVSVGDSSTQVKCFSIYRGVKSEVKEISPDPLSGTILGNGNIWFLIVGAAFIVGFCVFGIETINKKKKSNS